jgi:hypothetical protein
MAVAKIVRVVVPKAVRLSKAVKKSLQLVRGRVGVKKKLTMTGMPSRSCKSRYEKSAPRDANKRVNRRMIFLQSRQRVVAGETKLSRSIRPNRRATRMGTRHRARPRDPQVVSGAAARKVRNDRTLKVKGRVVR